MKARASNEVKNILILYATAGVGHKRAALAIKDAFSEKEGISVLVEDALNYTNRFFKICYSVIYLFLIRYIPTLWGFFYYVLDNPHFYTLLRPLRRLINYINSRKLVEFLLRTKPDTVIVTHFFPLEVIANLKKRKLLETRLVSVITDYQSHIFWLSKDVDTYVVGSGYTKNDLIKRGIPNERILVFGIPCAKSFSEERNLEALRSKLDLERGKKTLFILGGGFGVGPIQDIVFRLDKLEEDFQVIIVCGYNKKLYNVIKKMAYSTKHNFKLYGFVDNVDELMAVSSLLISKPGGMTVQEALNARLPMVVVDPIPGQEMRNYRFLERHSAALKIRNSKEIGNVVKELLSSNRLDILRDNAEKIRLADSARRIADEVDK